jgi:hypothetical protein
MTSYYLGYVFKNNTINALNSIQKILNNENEKFEIFNVKMYEKTHCPLIYLGNINDSLVNHFTNYLNNLLLVIVKENKDLNCELTNIDVIHLNNQNGVIINYKNDLLSHKIIPFLKKFGTDHIIETNYLDQTPLYIPLIDFNTNNFEVSKNIILSNIYSPTNKLFDIHSIDIYKKNENNEITIVSSFPFSN